MIHGVVSRRATDPRSRRSGQEMPDASPGGYSCGISEKQTPRYQHGRMGQ